jgi:hypothetical protein
MDGGSFPADHMQQISQASAAEVELRRNLVQFAPHLVLKLDELLQEERSRLRQQDYEMMYMQEECDPCPSARNILLISWAPIVVASSIFYLLPDDIP